MYARIQDGIVFEIIEDAAKIRPEAPAALPDGYQPTPEEQSARESQQLAHDTFEPGLIPLEERFAPWMVAQLVAVPEGLAITQGWQFDGSTFFPPAPPAPPTEAQVLADRDGRLARAALRIAPLEDAVELGEATAAEEATLLAWRQYRIKVNRVGLQPGYPTAVEWPSEPT